MEWAQSHKFGQVVDAHVSPYGIEFEMGDSFYSVDKMFFSVLARLTSMWPLKRGAMIDDQWDHANRSFMFVMFAMFGFVMTMRQHVGRHIACTGFTKFSEEFARDYCWTQGLYSAPAAYDVTPPGQQQVPHPGIIPEGMVPCDQSRTAIACPHPEDISPPRRVYHLWYHWVPFYFWMNALLFYTPYLVLKKLAFSEIKPLVSMINESMGNEEELRKTIRIVSTSLYHHLEVYCRKKTSLGLIYERYKLAVVHIFVKCLYLIVSVSIFCLTDKMFALGKFFTYGYDWSVSMYEEEEEVASTLVRHRLFPKMIACEIRQWGASGLENEQGMCVLSPNVINQYVFLICWFALVTIILLNAVSVLLAITKYPLVNAGYRRFARKSLMVCGCGDTSGIERMYRDVGASGRIILHLLAANIQPKPLEAIVRSVAHKLHTNDVGAENDVGSVENGECGGRNPLLCLAAETPPE